MGRMNNIFETMLGVSFPLSHWWLSHPARSVLLFVSASAQHALRPRHACLCSFLEQGE
jgi:hypothetical protein